MAYNLKETIIIVFAYNRPIHLGKTLKSLSLNPIAREIRTRIIIDGPKSSKDKNNVEKTIETAYAQMKSANSEIKFVLPTLDYTHRSHLGSPRHLKIMKQSLFLKMIMNYHPTA